MELATVDEVAAVMGGPSDFTRTNTLIGLASALVAEVMGYAATPNPVPAVAKTVTIAAVIRGLINPTGISAQQAGAFSTSFSKDAGLYGIYLTDEERAALERLKPGIRGLFTVATYRGDPIGAPRYTPVLGSDKPLPIDA